MGYSSQGPADQPEYFQSNFFAMPPATRTTFALVLLGAVIFGDLLGVATSTVDGFAHAGMTDREYAAAQQDSNDVDLPSLVSGCSGCLQFFLLIGSAVTFCMWMYQANVTARNLGAQGMQFTAGWAVGWFFVPIMNLFRPYLAAQEIWKASDPDVPRDKPFDWRASRSSALIGMWWGAWIFTNVLSQISFRITLKGTTRGAAVAGEAMSALADLVSIVAAALAMSWIWQVRQRQLKRYARAGR